MRDRTHPPTVIPAGPGWWAFHAVDDPEQPWAAYRVAAWLVSAERRRHDGEAFAMATPLDSSMEGFLSDSEPFAILHERELPAAIRERLEWVTPELLNEQAREWLDLESRYRRGAA